MALPKIFQLGVNDDQPEWLKKKLVTANFINIGLLPLSAFFTVTTYFLFPEVFYFCLFGLGVSTSSLVLLALRFHLAGRFILAITPILLGIVFAGMLLPADQEPAIGLLLACFSFVTITMVVFDFKHERLLVIISSIINVAVFQSFDMINAYFELDIDDSLLREGWLAEMMIWIGIVNSFAMLFTLAYSNLEAENTIKDILKDANSKNEELQATQQDMKEKMKELSDRQLQEKQSTWVTNGLAKFSALFRENDNDLDALAQTTLSQLAEYMNVQHGMLFIENDSEERPELEVKAAWAFDESRALEKNIGKGEGLIGQCWVEGEEIYLTDLPAGFVRIESGMGAANPTSIFVSPIKVNDQTCGVIELASLRTLDAHEMEFIRKLSEILATTILATKNNQHTSKLLRDAEQMSEQLLAQEEMMRQSAEDIHAFQEEQEKRIKELEAELEALRK